MAVQKSQRSKGKVVLRKGFSKIKKNLSRISKNIIITKNTQISFKKKVNLNF
jgi:hypothetical protein